MSSISPAAATALASTLPSSADTPESSSGDNASEGGAGLFQSKVLELLERLYSGDLTEDQAAAQLAGLTRQLEGGALPPPQTQQIEGDAPPQRQGGAEEGWVAAADGRQPLPVSTSPRGITEAAAEPARPVFSAFESGYVLSDPGKLMRLISKASQIRSQQHPFPPIALEAGGVGDAGSSGDASARAGSEPMPPSAARGGLSLFSKATAALWGSASEPSSSSGNGGVDTQSREHQPSLRPAINRGGGATASVNPTVGSGGIMGMAGSLMSGITDAAATGLALAAGVSQHASAAAAQSYAAGAQKKAPALRIGGGPFGVHRGGDSEGDLADFSSNSSALISTSRPAGGFSA